MDFSVILLVFGVVFIAELPDKSMFASLTLSTRYRKLYVWIGAASAFLVHVIIAVTAGHFLTLLPRRGLEIVVAILFAFGAGLLLFGKNEDEEKFSKSAFKQTKQLSQSFPKIFITSFLVIFLGEWGDITQIVTANYAAKYHNPLSVGIGAVLGLWTVSAFGIIVGTKVLAKIPARTVQRVTGIILLLFAVLSAVAALKH
jgi:putative Ca2+/H+ antiporter (TMEM165/GDT1 family)